MGNWELDAIRESRIESPFGNGTAEQFNALCHEIGASFQRDEEGHARAVGVGLPGRTSRFYAAHGLYSAVHTCNHWTTQTMRAGGLNASLAPTETWSSGAVVAQARRLVTKRARAAAGSQRRADARVDRAL
ncbi:MAG: DUF2459 domain-containing protein [Chthoniobacterales bacterium]|nr:DUF2459 domain-containing protein [Chthoniobacterales bacterium]